MKIKNANTMRKKSDEVNKDELTKFINNIKYDIENGLNHIYNEETGSYTFKMITYNVESYILKGAKNNLKELEKYLENLGYEFLMYNETTNDKELVNLIIKISW